MRQDPRSTFAYVPLAMAMTDAAEIQGAERSYALLAGQDAELSALGRADLSLYRRDAADAQRILVDAPNAHAQALLAEVLVAQGKKARAIDALRKVMNLSHDTRALCVAARVYVQAGREAEAQSLARELAQRESKEARACAKIIEAEITSQLRDTQATITALQSSPGLPDIWLRHFALAVTYIEGGEYSSGLSELEIVQKRPGEAMAIFLDDYPTVHYFRTLRYWFGRAHDGLRMKSAAIVHYRRFLEIQSSSADDAIVGDAKRRLEDLRHSDDHGRFIPETRGSATFGCERCASWRRSNRASARIGFGGH